ncbi:DUF6059 family protein [Streptomyces sp. NPDC048182]|uniref:DUF6059 family protein n=1 Tax=unclassified Streptomyces TaxID=2593676 RepID=UPI0033A40141
MMRRLARGARWLVLERCLWPFGRSLMSFGAMYIGGEALEAAFAPRPGSRAHLASLGPGVGGPPPGHPERLCAEVPLSELERALAGEVWPAPARPRRRES